jgi:hypothetical protein
MCFFSVLLIVCIASLNRLSFSSFSMTFTYHRFYSFLVGIRMKHSESFCSQTCIILTRQILLIFLESPKHIFSLFQIHITDSWFSNNIHTLCYLLRESWTLIYFSCFSYNFERRLCFSPLIQFYNSWSLHWKFVLFSNSHNSQLFCFVYVRKSKSSSSFIRFFSPSSTIATRFVYNDDHSQNFELEFEFVLMSNKGVNSSDQ